MPAPAERLAREFAMHASPALPGAGLAARLAALRGWRRHGLALLMGAIAAAALPPLSIVPLLWPAFMALTALLRNTARVRAAFALGFWFGFGHFLTGLYWLAWPLTLDLARFGWMIPFAVFGVSAVLALFTGLATASAHVSRLEGAGRILILAAAWSGAEWLRGHVLTGFPWNLLATAWVTIEPIAQIAALAGAYGLGLFTVAIAAAPSLLFDRSLPRVQRWAAAAIPVALLAAAWAWGGMRIEDVRAAAVPDVRLRLVQGNIEQSLKWAEERREATFALYLDLTRSPGFERVTHVVWPETAIDYRFDTTYAVVRIAGERLTRIAAAVPRDGALITGAIRDRGNNAWFNSVHVIGDGGRVVSTYDKHHLVPFGEYLPLRDILRRLGVEQMAHGMGDYSAGPGPASLTVPRAPAASPLVCYEVIFPGKVAPRARRSQSDAAARPGWLLNVTNDAWFGLTSGPYQHFASARLRAIEEGLPLVRAANTGITAVVDAYGRVTARLPIARRGTIDADLPRAAEPTLYARLGDRSFLVVLLAALLLALALNFRARREPPAKI